MTEAEREWMERVINCARSLVKNADEFWPDFPDAVGESLSHLENVLNEDTSRDPL